MNKIFPLAIMVAALTSFEALGQEGNSPTLTLEGARSIIAAAAAEGRRVNAPGGAIAVVDEGGHLLAMERWNNTFPAAAQISIGKARTAALFRKPTKQFEDAINKGRTAMTALPDSVLTPLQGGVPIEVGGKVIGAVGMSGAASAQQDEELAIAGIKGLFGNGQ
ncbi:MAG TPA: heme-binding protein [Burkholderiales bacterium]|nr:heme-binding protein [Burkholderiales bacterium]